MKHVVFVRFAFVVIKAKLCFITWPGVWRMETPINTNKSHFSFTLSRRHMICSNRRAGSTHAGLTRPTTPHLHSLYAQLIHLH